MGLYKQNHSNFQAQGVILGLVKKKEKNNSFGDSNYVKVSINIIAIVLHKLNFLFISIPNFHTNIIDLHRYRNASSSH